MMFDYYRIPQTTAVFSTLTNMHCASCVLFGLKMLSRYCLPAALATPVSNHLVMLTSKGRGYYVRLAFRRTAS